MTKTKRRGDCVNRHSGYRSILVCLCVLALVVVVALGGCGGSSSDGTSGGPGTTWVAQPPIHVTQGVKALSAGYTPAQIRHAYGVDRVTGTGSGQVIALVDAYGSPTIQADLNTFCTKYGLPKTTVQIAYPQGKPYQNNGGWALETSLDVEWAHAIAPGATILLVVANSDGFSPLLAAIDYAAQHASQVSMSWAGSEFSGETSDDSHFNKSGVSFFSAAGDSGVGAQWPAVSPFVTGVGGTTLSLDASGNIRSETAWSGSNGGPSSYETEPSFQTGWQSGGRRETPDVCYDGDPNTGVEVYDSTPYQRYTGWSIVGGTSAGSPQPTQRSTLWGHGLTSLPTTMTSPPVPTRGIQPGRAMTW